MSLDFLSVSVPDILSEANNLENLSSDSASFFHQNKISLEQENCNPSLNCDIELKKVPVHLRHNRTRNPPSRPSSQKQSKLNKIQNDLRSILKNTSQKQLLHSQSFQLESKEEYPTLLKRKNTATLSHKQDFQDLSNKDFLQIITVSHEDVNFGKVLPGSIIEKVVEIKNRTVNNLAIRIHVICKDAVLREIDEYVFSVAEINKFNYHEKLLLVLQANSSVRFSLGLKVPNIKDERLIEGTYSIEIIGLNKMMTHILEATTRIPQFSCIKEIYDSQNKLFILKFALKKGKKQDFKVLFKNESEFCLDGCFEILENQRNLENELMMYPGTACIEAFSIFTLNFMVKPKSAGIGFRNLHNLTTLNKVLLFKVKNSSLIYFFALAIELY